MRGPYAYAVQLVVEPLVVSALELSGCLRQGHVPLRTDLSKGVAVRQKNSISSFVHCLPV
jgi:hypothetical protein